MKIWKIKVMAKDKDHYTDNKQLLNMLRMGYKRLISLNIAKNDIMIEIINSRNKDKYISKRFEDDRLPLLKELNDIDREAKWRGFIFYYKNEMEITDF
jgi:hypothetical protein